MSKILFAFICGVAGFCSCTKPIKEMLPVPKISGESMSPRPPISSQKIDFTANDTTIVFGDSWTDYGFNASNFIKSFADSSGQFIFNKAEIGFSSGNMIREAFKIMDTIHNNKNIITLCGFNDVRLCGATNESLNFQKNAYRTLLVNQFIDTWRPAGAPNRKGGLFTSFDQPLTGHFKSYYSSWRKAAYTSATNGVFLEYDFIGSNVGISFVGQDTTTMDSYENPHGRWRVLIDGVVIDTPAIHQQSDGHRYAYMSPQKIFPYIRIYSGLSGGHHVLRLEPIENGSKFVDFIFTLRDPSLVSPVTIMKVPYMTEAGYLIDPFANKASDAAINFVNLAFNEVQNEFVAINPGYSKKIKLINTADYFNRDKDYLPDLIHPNGWGQLNLFKALYTNIAY